MPDHGIEYFEGLMVGVQKSLDDLQDWLKRYEDGHKAELVALYARMAAIEQKMVHESSTRAAWNQLFGAIGAAILAGLTFFSGVFNNLFAHTPNPPPGH